MDGAVTGACAMAPVRLDLAGGWTDVPPFSTREGGVVVNAAINLFARAEARRATQWRIRSTDLQADVELGGSHDDVTDTRVMLHAAALRVRTPSSPVELSSSSDFPPGAGLGGSGAMDAALIGALELLEGRALRAHHIAELAWQLEAIEAGVPGGKQDQFVSAHGGINLMRFDESRVDVEPLELAPRFAAELAGAILLCYTGASRLSGDTIARVMGRYDAGDATVTGALRELRELARDMAGALRVSDLDGVGDIMSRNWLAQQRLDGRMATPGMRELEGAMYDCGALGGKAAGSGAGGCMFFVVPRGRARAERVAMSLGATILPVSWSREGVRPC